MLPQQPSDKEFKYSYSGGSAMKDDEKLKHDVSVAGIYIEKDGKRIDPKDFYCDNSEKLNLCPSVGQWGMTDEKLIELMAERHIRYCHDEELEVQDESTQGGYKNIAKELLSVIRQNVHLVAEVCPECNGGGESIVNTKMVKASSFDMRICDAPSEYAVDEYGVCLKCKGHGVVPKPLDKPNKKG